MDPAFLQAYWDQAAPVIALANALQPEADVIVGETSAAWHSGQCGTTNRFNGCFWYANALGRMARGGVQGLAFHSFNGGCYAMIDRATMRPHPHYWVGKLFSLLMGDAVLDLRPVLGDASKGNQAELLTYAHVARRFQGGAGKGATLLLINLSPTQTFEVDLSDARGLMAPRYEYHLAAKGGLSSDDVELNGHRLAYDGGAHLPDLEALAVYSNDSSVAIAVAPQS